MRFIILRILVPLFLFIVVRYVLRTVFSSLKQPAGPQHRTEVPTGGELKRDPVCGTYVAAGTSLTRQIKGETHYFCSKECRDKYRAA